MRERARHCALCFSEVPTRTHAQIFHNSISIVPTSYRYAHAPRSHPRLRPRPKRPGTVRTFTNTKSHSRSVRQRALRISRHRARCSSQPLGGVAVPPSSADPNPKDSRRKRAVGAAEGKSSEVFLGGWGRDGASIMARRGARDIFPPRLTPRERAREIMSERRAHSATSRVLGFGASVSLCVEQDTFRLATAHPSQVSDERALHLERACDAAAEVERQAVGR